MSDDEYEVVTFTGTARSITIDPELMEELGIHDISYEQEKAVVEALAKFLGKSLDEQQ